MMMRNQSSQLSLFCWAIIAALCLTVLPLPIFLAAYRPDWLLLVMVCWYLNELSVVPMTVIWLIGLIQDLLVNGPLGLHALILVSVCFWLNRLYSWLAGLPVWQKIIVFFVINLSVILFQWSMMTLLHQYTSILASLAVMLVNLLLWPWVFRLINGAIRRINPVY
jgi:rod shape-determining protein MreD